MWWVFFRCVKILLGSVIIGLIIQQDASAWSMKAQPRHQLSEVRSTNTLSCPGTFSTITLRGSSGQVEACVMGDNTKIASYYSSNGNVLYGVSFPHESTYYPLDVCRDIWGCVYSEEKDTFVGLSMGDDLLKSGVIYRNFVQHLKKTVVNDATYFSISDASRPYLIVDFEDKILNVESVTVSHNGEWVLVELKGYGVLRIEVQTLQVRRITTKSVAYVSPNDRRAEMAITDDGNTVATMGLGRSIMLYNTNDS